MTSPQPFRFFDVTVAESVDLTPSFRRVRLEGPDLRHFGDPGWDQRIKVVLPRDGLSYEVLPRGGDWYTSWRDLPAEQRHPLRTYTTRRVSGGQLEIDFVRHQPAIGPAAQWIENAAVGDFLVILGPNAEWDGEAGGIDFVPPARTENYLLVGDETAAPAIAVMLENLPPSASGIAVLELPHDADAAYLPTHPGFDVRCAARGSQPRGSFLVPAGTAAARELTPPGTGHDVEEIDIDHDLLWEVPRAAKGGAALSATTLYAWIAGEAGGVKALRRSLVSEVGLDRRSVAFMGYWREGRAEAN